MSYAGLGQTLAVPGETVGLDHSGVRHVSGGSVRVGARWAQRAVNAGNRYNNSSAPLIGVDGQAGPVTIAGLRTLSHQFSSDQPATNDPVGTRVTSTVIIPLALESALATKTLIPDPPLAAATRHTTTSPSTGAPVTAPIPGVPPVAPADEIILDEGSSAGGGLIARWGIWPWAIGGAALVGVGIWFMQGGGMRANRKRVRRNYRYSPPRRRPAEQVRFYSPVPMAHRSGEAAFQMTEGYRRARPGIDYPSEYEGGSDYEPSYDETPEWDRPSPRRSSRRNRRRS
jgi:hypothetical protein